jgi:hypothetical protein
MTTGVDNQPVDEGFNGDRLTSRLAESEKNLTGNTAESTYADGIVRFINGEEIGTIAGPGEFMAAQFHKNSGKLEQERVAILREELGAGNNGIEIIMAGDAVSGWGENGSISAISYGTNVPGLTLVYEMPPIKGTDGMQSVILKRELTSEGNGK